MPRKLPPYVECWRDRHGRLRVYFRKAKGQRIPLPVDIASDAFASRIRPRSPASVNRRPSGLSVRQPAPSAL